MEDISALLAVPGMSWSLRAAPVVAAALWLLISVSLWRGGFTDLVEQLTRPRWTRADRLRALAMLPIRAVLLTLVAAFAAAMTTAGLLFNAAVVLNVAQVVRAAL
ncbi:hypothetical protein [Maricaulis sp. CAU 1757]